MNESWKSTRSLARFGFLALAIVCVLVVGGCGQSSTDSSKQQAPKKSSGKQAKKSSSQPASTAASPAGGTTLALTSASTSATSAMGNATTMQMTSGTTMVGPTTGATTVGAAPEPSTQNAQAGGGEKFPVRIGANGNEDPKLWPDACKMLSDKEIQNIVPQVKKISRVGQHAEFLSGGETPNYSSCDYKLPRPSDPYGPDQPSTVTVNLQGVAAPKLIEQQYKEAKAQQKETAKKYPDQYKDYGKSLGGADCFWDGNEIQCIKGHFNFWVLGQQVTGGNSLKADKQWRSEVLTEVIKTLASKMS